MLDTTFLKDHIFIVYFQRTLSYQRAVFLERLHLKKTHNPPPTHTHTQRRLNTCFKYKIKLILNSEAETEASIIGSDGVTSGTKVG